MQKHALHNEEMKTIINILIISDTSKDFFICFNFFFIEAMLCRRRYLTLHIYFAAVFGAGFCGIFWCFFFLLMHKTSPCWLKHGIFVASRVLQTHYLFMNRIL